MKQQDKGKKECPFCKADATVHANNIERKFVYADCLCGKFIIEQNVIEDRGYNGILKTDEDKILFSGYLRNNQNTEITEVFIREELERILDYCKQKTLDEKISEIKKYIYQKTTTLGAVVPINYYALFTLFYLRTNKELLNLIKYLQDANILDKNTDISNSIGNAILTVEGFSKIEATLKDYAQSKNVFISYKFKTPYEEKLVETIMAACTACGFDANRVKDERHNYITNKIIADIKESRFIIADFTDQNNSVYFEAGYAMGESKEVIRLVNEKQFKKLHFDTRQFPLIPWKHGEWKELEEDLINQIKVTILKDHD